MFGSASKSNLGGEVLLLLNLVHECFVGCAPHLYSIIYYTEDQRLNDCFPSLFTKVVLYAIYINYGTKYLTTYYNIMCVKSHMLIEIDTKILKRAAGNYSGAIDS